MQNPATATQASNPKAHASRLAPHCTDCAHFVPGDKLCNHPSAAVDPVTGRPKESAYFFREAKGGGDGVCGLSGRLFERVALNVSQL
jgi:hypothetical protein